LVKGVEKMYSYGGVDRKYIEEIQRLRGVKEKAKEPWWVNGFTGVFVRIIVAVAVTVLWVKLFGPEWSVLIAPLAFFITWFIQVRRATRDIPVDRVKDEKWRKEFREKWKDEDEEESLYDWMVKWDLE